MIWGCFNNNESLTSFTNLMTKTNSIDWSKSDPVHRGSNEANVVDASVNTKDNISNADNDDGTKVCGDIHEIDIWKAKGDICVNRNWTNGTLINDIGLDGVKTVVGNCEEGVAGDME